MAPSLSLFLFWHRLCPSSCFQLFYLLFLCLSLFVSLSLQILCLSLNTSPSQLYLSYRTCNIKQPFATNLCRRRLSKKRQTVRLLDDIWTARVHANFPHLARQLSPLLASWVQQRQIDAQFKQQMYTHSVPTLCGDNTTSRSAHSSGGRSWVKESVRKKKNAGSTTRNTLLDVLILLQTNV